MRLEVLLRHLSKGKTGNVTVDIGGAKVSLTVSPDGEIKAHNVEFSNDYVAELLKGHASTILGVKHENAIMVNPQYTNVDYDTTVINGYLCVPSDRAERV